MLRTVTATRYVAPLREGGSMPALVEADDDGLYVVKLRGAGQGVRVLVAEVVVGELARGLGLAVPEIVVVEIDGDLAAAEPDPEIQELVAASGGANAGLDFLPRALPYVPGTDPQPTPDEAAAVVWLDALCENVDRTPRNPNLLAWHGAVRLIDHGAALYRQHAGLRGAETQGRFPMVRDHVLLPVAGSIADADARLAPLVTPERIAEVVGLVPPDWLGDDGPAPYVDWLGARLGGDRPFVAEAEEARRAR